MASPSSRRLSPWIATPLLAVAVFGIAACSPPGQDTSNVRGTVPPVFTGGPGPANSTTTPNASSGEVVQVTLHDAAGKVAGSATFANDGAYVKVTVHAEGLTPGFHGMHIHTVAKCEPNSTAPNSTETGNFLSAGGHWQVGAADAMPMTGQLPSLDVLKDGSADISFDSDAFTLDDLLANGGHSIIIHADTDNFGNIPSRYTQAGGATGADEKSTTTGDAGARVVCGVISK